MLAHEHHEHVVDFSEVPVRLRRLWLHFPNPRAEGCPLVYSSLTYGSFEKGVIPPPIRPDERSTELHPYSPGLCTSLSPGGWPPILDLPISKKIPGSIWFSIKVILFLFLYIWVRAAFPRYRYDQLMGLGRKVFLPLSLARVVPVSGVLVTFQWLP